MIKFIYNQDAANIFSKPKRKYHEHRQMQHQLISIISKADPNVILLCKYVSYYVYFLLHSIKSISYSLSKKFQIALMRVIEETIEFIRL